MLKNTACATLTRPGGATMTPAAYATGYVARLGRLLMFSWPHRCSVIIGLFLVSACAGSSSSPTPPANANPTSITITVTGKGGGPVFDVSVVLSTSIVDGQPGGVISSDPTNSGGQVTFFNLPRSGQLCVYAITNINGPVQHASHCAYPFPAGYTLKLG